MSRIECARAPHLPLLWPARQWLAAVEHNDVTPTLDLHTTGRVAHTPISHVSFASSKYHLQFIIDLALEKILSQLEPVVSESKV